MTERLMTARFAGRCPKCGAAIAVGDSILYDGKARHAECPEVAPAVAEKAAEATDAAPGYYVRDAAEGREVIVVVLSKTSGHAYAKRLVIQASGHARWEYAPGVHRQLDGRDILTLDEAKALGKLHGICMICGRQLTVPAHAEAGIGPVCVKKLGGYGSLAAPVAKAAKPAAFSTGAADDAEMDRMVHEAEVAEDRRVAEFKYQRDLALDRSLADMDPEPWSEDLELDAAGRDCDGVYYETRTGGWDHR